MSSGYLLIQLSGIELKLLTTISNTTRNLNFLHGCKTFKVESFDAALSSREPITRLISLSMLFSYDFSKLSVDFISKLLYHLHTDLFRDSHLVFFMASDPQSIRYIFFSATPREELAWL